MSHSDQSPSMTRDELRSLARELLEEMKGLNDRVDVIRRRLFEESRAIRHEMRSTAAAKKPGRVTVFHEADGSTKVVHD